MNQRIYLNGEWEFCRKGTEEWKTGIVPGCVQMDLMRLGNIPDPFYGLNEMEAFKLEDEEWVYKKDFCFDSNPDNLSSIKLVFDGVDCVADIYLNDVMLGHVENMFIPHCFEVKGSIRTGTNQIEVHFYSTVKVARSRLSASTEDLGFCCDPAAPYVRKAHYAFGWDWSPRILQVGLWRPVHIELIEKAKIINPFFYTSSLTEEKASVKVEAEVVSNYAFKLKADVIISLDDRILIHTDVPIAKRKGKAVVCLEAEILDPQLWFPNGMGKQPLYKIRILLKDDYSVIADHEFRSGIRLVKLLREKDADGESFIFEVNGYKVFCKGANWIPADNLLPRVSAGDYYDYIRSAKDAGMNMLMVWGGGIYEDTAFYNACDEMGIMVWQTFMLHYCQLPDHTDWMQKLMEEEAESVILRLRNHPSIVLWCGECENGWFYDREARYKGNYSVDVIIPKILSEKDPTREYRRGTPWGGKDANSMAEGDRHSYNVWLNWEDYDGYRNDTARFVSEFGAQAMPCWKSIAAYTPPEEMHLLSDVTLSHNKLIEGTERMVRYMVGRLGIPKDFKCFCYLSQFNQAESVKTAVEHWRGRKFRTAGTLFWMFNDCWPGASWSCIDYFKRKKALYYYARNFYSNIVPLVKHENDNIYIEIISDYLTDTAVQVRLSAYNLRGAKLYETIFDASAGANQTSRIKTVKVSELGIGFTSCTCIKDTYFTTTPVQSNEELLNTVLFIEVQEKHGVYKNYLVFDRFRRLKLIKPEIMVKINGNQISLISNVPAFGVFAETENDVELSDNCLNMEPDIEYIITCSSPPGGVEVFGIADMCNNLVL